ncbi:MAG TPA: sigma-70 family RNA polymerase sigma factor [Anaerolineales bacterium]|nr:sigma-70 family RNA polymerase sigma factor [Anaerolineales bacterium]
MPNNGSLLTRSAPFPILDQMEWSDEQLIRAAQANPQAFDTLYRRYVERIYAYLYCLTYDPHEAEDMTSQTFLSAWKGLRYYHEKGTFAAWLFHIARNKARDLHRKKHPQITIDDIRDLPAELDTAAGFEEEENLQRVIQLIRRLDPEQIDLLRLRFGAGLSYAEIGSVLGRNSEATKMVFHRIFQKLRTEWKEFDE